MIASSDAKAIEVHDREILKAAQSMLDHEASPQKMADAVLRAVQRNEEWRGKRCLNLLAPEAPTSPTVRKLLSAEIGTRAAEGHIGRVNRWFAGTQYIDEVESLCVELLKRAFRCRYADHRLMGSMLGNMAVYHALSRRGDTIMTAPQPFGGHSSNRLDGPAGMRGLKIVDVPFDPVERARFERMLRISGCRCRSSIIVSTMVGHRQWRRKTKTSLDMRIAQSVRHGNGTFESDMSQLLLSLRGHIHDSAVYEHRIHRVDRDRLAGTEQYHLAAVKTDLDLGMANDPVMAVIRPPGLLDLQLI